MAEKDEVGVDQDAPVCNRSLSGVPVFGATSYFARIAVDGSTSRSPVGGATADADRASHRRSHLCVSQAASTLWP